VYGKVVGFVVVCEFVFGVWGVLGKVMINGYVHVDVAGWVSERCCLALYGMKVAVSLASVKWYVGIVYGKLD
jgi:hypothetical protein